jgi:HK97 family phage prohead protease
MATATTTAKHSTSVSDRPQPEAGTKSVVVKFKTDGLADGEFIGYASVFGNKDSYGDVVIKGAFANTLAEWERKGVPIPLLWGHNTADPDFNLGEIVTAEEDDKGLKVHGRLDMESPKSAQTYRLLKSGRVNQMSFAYHVVDGAYIQPEGDDKTWRDAYYELRELELYEVSIVPIGANQETEILAVKAITSALQAKAGRALSSKNEDALRGALSQAEEVVTALKDVLSAVDSDDDDTDEEDQDKTSGKEPPAGATETKSPSQPDAATPSPSVSLALMEIETLAQGDAEL